jgi:aldehyde dehydrogenase (NAD+)
MTGMQETEAGPQQIHRDAFYIDGVWSPPSGARRITVLGANTGAPIGSVPEAESADLDLAVMAARRAFDDPHGWATWPAGDRAAVLRRFANALEARREEMIFTISSANGMPISMASEVESALPARVLRYYADLVSAARFEEDRPGMFNDTVTVRREPMGVVGAIVPWNAPQILGCMKYAPALAVGCTVVMKPSPETVLDSYVLAEAALDAGLPAGVMNILPGGSEIGAKLVSHPGVDKVAFTGSTAAGRLVAEACGRLLRPVSLELGGKSAAIMLDDMDLDGESLAQALFNATMVNNGQTCYLSTRILAPKARYAEIVDFMSSFVTDLVLGDSRDPNTQIGPLVSERQRERVEGYIAAGVRDGARLVAGGGRPGDRDQGWFVEPTIFAEVDNHHLIAREEIFGPVLSIIEYSDVEDAIAIANDSDYGLGGTVWTTDPDRGLEIARRVRTGTFGINNCLPDPAAPLGGYKDSGIGREYGPEALSSFQQVKSIYH